MAEGNKNIDNKRKAPPKPDGSASAKGSKADAGDPAKPADLMDELESKLNDFFALDPAGAGPVEKSPAIKPPPDDAGETPKSPKAAASAKDTTGKIKTGEPAAPAAAAKTGKAPISPAPREPAPASTGPAEKNLQKQKMPAASLQKPAVAAKETDRVKPAGTGAAAGAEPSRKIQKKESAKTDVRAVKKKRPLVKFAVAGIVLVGSVLALLIFFQTPEPLNRDRPATAPTTQKIKLPPAKAPAAKAAPPAVSPVPQRPEPAQIKSEIPMAAGAVDEKKPVPPAGPGTDAGAEIKNFLQEWKTAWEKSAGENGDTNAFMTFYSDDFASDGFDKKKWRRDKAEKNRIKEWIRIKLDKIQIVGPLKNGQYEARFNQVYQSSNYADTSDQILVLKKEAGGWKIIGLNPKTPVSYPYSIHGGSYRTRTAAQEAVEAYHKMGLEAYWIRADLGEKGTWYRVLIGYYNTPESARGIIKAKSLTDVKLEETRYASLIGTYASEDELKRQRRLIVEKGYSPYVITDAAGNFNLYVGAYASLKNAEKISAELNAGKIPSRTVER